MGEMERQAEELYESWVEGKDPSTLDSEMEKCQAKVKEIVEELRKDGCDGCALAASAILMGNNLLQQAYREKKLERKEG